MAADKIPVSGIKERETAPSDNLNAENSERFINQATSVKPQAIQAASALEVLNDY